MTTTSPALRPLDHFTDNIQYARGMVETGGHLKREREEDLYRAAWVQAVAALDRWVHEELYQRAAAIALDTSADRSNQFLKFEVPWEKVEDIHHGRRRLRDVFLEALEEKYGHQSFQSTHHIGLAFSLVLGNRGVKTMWQRTTNRLNMDKSALFQRHDEQVVRRRNQISHASDIDPVTRKRRGISEPEATGAITWIESFVIAINHVLPATGR